MMRSLFTTLLERDLSISECAVDFRHTKYVLEFIFGNHKPWIIDNLLDVFKEEYECDCDMLRRMKLIEDEVWDD